MPWAVAGVDPPPNRQCLAVQGFGFVEAPGVDQGVREVREIRRDRFALRAERRAVQLQRLSIERFGLVQAPQFAANDAQIPDGSPDRGIAGAKRAALDLQCAREQRIRGRVVGHREDGGAEVAQGLRDAGIVRPEPLDA